MHAPQERISNARSDESAVIKSGTFHMSALNERTVMVNQAFDAQDEV